MNDVIERRFAAVIDRRYRSNERKLRTDSILGGLPSAQRAMVDKWLFDKGMTYQEVAKACGKMFGVTVGKSSVGRYFQAKSKVQGLKSKVGMAGFQVQSPRSKVGEGVGRGVSEKVGEWVGEEEKSQTVEAGYERLLARVREMAWLEAKLPEALRDVKWFCQLMRILIAARRERNRAVLAAVARARFEKRAAGEVLKHLRFTNDDLRRKRKQPQRGWRL